MSITTQEAEKIARNIRQDWLARMLHQKRNACLEAFFSTLQRFRDGNVFRYSLQLASGNRVIYYGWHPETTSMSGETLVWDLSRDWLGFLPRARSTHDGSQEPDSWYQRQEREPENV